MTVNTGVVPDVLLVDDDAISLLVAEMLLKHAGFTVATAKDGVDAIAQLKLGAARLVVTDLEMPHLGGLGLIEWLRSTPSLATTPVIVITGHSDSHTLSELNRHGADDYLLKPIDPNMLVEAVTRFVTPA